MSIFADATGFIKRQFIPLNDSNPINPDEKPKQSPEELISELEIQLNDAIDNRATVEKTWFLNIAAIMGKQWVTWNDYTKNYDAPKAPDYRVRMVDNQVLVTYDKRLAKITSVNPKYVVTPNSNDEKDIEASRLGTKVIKGLKNKLKFRVLKMLRSQWQLLCGTVFVYFSWDKDAGDELPADPFNPTAPVLHMGEINQEVVNPFEIYCLDGSGYINQWERICWMRYVAIDKIKAMCPSKEIADQIKPETDDSKAGMYAKKIETISTLNVENYQKPKASDKGAFLKWVFERPSKDHPKGRFVSYCNGVLMWVLPMPNINLGKEFEMPFLEYNDLQIPNRTWGQSRIEQILPVNRELNKSRSQIIENKNKMGNPKIMIVQNSVSDTAFTDEQGEMVEVNMAIPGAQMPQALPVSPLPNYVTTLPAELKTVIQDMTAIHDVSQAKAPPGVKSGKAIANLQGDDNSALGPLLQQASENDVILWTASLKLVGAKYTEQRLLTIAGDDNMPEVMAFSGTDLRNNTTVWVEDSDIVPESRYDRQSKIEDWYYKGLLGNQQNDETRKRALRMMEVGNTDEMWTEGTLDNIKAKAENKRMIKGEMIVPEWWENHEAELLEHIKVMKSPLFISKPPLVKSIFENHIKAHQDFLMPSKPVLPINQKIPVNK